MNENPPSSAWARCAPFMPWPAAASFKRAADMLGVSATAVSHQIKLLESVLECRVCERNAMGVSLTDSGEILYAGTQRAFSALEEATTQIVRSHQPPSLTVTTTSNF